jgi:hypothetical protein
VEDVTSAPPRCKRSEALGAGKGPRRLGRGGPSRGNSGSCAGPLHRARGQEHSAQPVRRVGQPLPCEVASQVLLDARALRGVLDDGPSLRILGDPAQQAVPAPAGRLGLGGAEEAVVGAALERVDKHRAGGGLEPVLGQLALVHDLVPEAGLRVLGPTDAPRRLPEEITQPRIRRMPLRELGKHVDQGHRVPPHCTAPDLR